MMALLRSMQIADVERRHRRSRVMTQMHKTWEHFCASYINTEAKSLLTTSLLERHLLKTSTSARQSPANLPRAARAYRKKRAPLQLYHEDCTRRDKLQGIAFNPRSASYWATVKREFQNLSAEVLARYRARSDSTAGEAAEHRAKRKLEETS